MAQIPAAPHIDGSEDRTTAAAGDTATRDEGRRVRSVSLGNSTAVGAFHGRRTASPEALLLLGFSGRTVVYLHIT